MMKLLSLSSVLILTALFSLDGFGQTESATGAEPEISGPSSMDLCTEVMTLNAQQLGSNEAEMERFILGCPAGAKYGSAAWQCALTAMQRGGSYVKSTDECFPKG